MSWWSQLFSDVFDPGGIFHDTKSKQEETERWAANYMLQQRSLMDQEIAFQYQKEYDKWQQDFALRNQEQSQSNFERQMNLAQSPVSTVVNDASKVGVNPMAALGQSAGSASYSSASSPSSSVNGGFGASPVSIPSTLGSMVSALGSVGSAHISASQSDKESKRNAALRQQELDIIREKNRNDFALGNRSADIAQQNANSQSTSVTGDLKIRQQLANANDRMSDLEFRKFAHNEMMDYRDLLLRQTQFNRSIYEDDRNYNQRVSEFNRQYDRLVAEFEGKIKNASKDRRMEYITRFSSQVARVASSLLGGGASFGDFFGSHSSTIGFQP